MAEISGCTEAEAEARGALLDVQSYAVLLDLATYLETDIEARSAITSALIYPAVVAAMAVVTVIVLATFVLPKFKTSSGP